jgi:hypothetical protein
LIQALIPGGKVGDIGDAGPEKGGAQGPQQYVKHNQPPGNASPFNAVILLHPALIFHKIPNKGPQLANPVVRGYLGLDKQQAFYY